MFLRLFFLFFLVLLINNSHQDVPIVLNTWKFTEATAAGWNTIISSNKTSIDAIVAGCTKCEQLQCDHTVGYGGSPDEHSESTLDAMIIDGSTMDMGAVAGLRRIKNAIGVAELILKHTKHSLLAGDLATEFAKSFGFVEENLTTNYSKGVWKAWYDNKCQPNFWKNVQPDPSTQCGPYTPSALPIFNSESDNNSWSRLNHDTIGLIAIDKRGNVAAGTSTNGASHKIPGRVGDSPVPGAGAYADSDVGAAVGTGDGDVMMRFLPSFLAVEQMREGKTPTEACRVAIQRIRDKYPDFFGAILASDKNGNYGAACSGMDYFPFSVAGVAKGVVVRQVKCD